MIFCVRSVFRMMNIANVWRAHHELFFQKGVLFKILGGLKIQRTLIKLFVLSIWQNDF